MKLTYESATTILDGLKALDGYSRAIKTNGEDRIIVEFYKLGGSVRLTIAKNMNLLKPVCDSLVEARNSLIKEISGGEPSIDVKKNPELAGKMWDEERSLLKEDAGDIPLLKISLESLKLDDNPIPASILATLSPILEDA